MSLFRPLLAAFRIVVLLALGVQVLAGEPEPRLEPGQYEQILLAVDPQGRVTGYYREQQGEGAAKTCAFYFAGEGKSGEISVVTWSDRARPGTLIAGRDSVTLRVEKGREHPGCGLVLLPQIAKGIKFDRVAGTEWRELRAVSSARAYFHRDPDRSSILKSFVVRGDVVGVVDQMGDWLKVEYVGKKGATKGWILSQDAIKLAPPER